MKQQVEGGDAIDVDALPVHPWAARFPMRSDDELQAMAQSIAAHGQRLPIVIGDAVLALGDAPTLCLIDGRNRLAACKLAGVAPVYTMLEGDADAWIADSNLERRDLTKGQKAMLIAVRFPGATNKGGRGHKKTTEETSEVSAKRVSQARAVYHYCPEMVDAVIAGETGLDEAYTQANLRRAMQEVQADRFEVLRQADPDLADLVTEERMKLSEAEAAARDRREREENALRSHAQSMKDIEARFASLGEAALDELARFYKSRPERFHTDDLIGSIDVWVKKALALKERLQ
ncbi:ParB/RepB/Spo0J family partition protein [Burkholderia territorii]|uniref:ParB/RepB/Spo0J family partition protein n=1 Tax=Burkholderia territorii TaxID=1503055 RepID=UPI0007545990|nr:ParB N-terminal domain-containing protein [Burkholderia territorii]KWO55947.1 hypothetical protein WT98_00030 [Burkholderia territorii]